MKFLREHRRRRGLIPIPKVSEIASPPGTLPSPEPSSSAPTQGSGAWRAIHYNRDSVEYSSSSDRLDGEISMPQSGVLWVNVDEVGDGGSIAALGERFGLHPLALEDSVTLHQRAKYEDYDDHFFLVIHMPRSTEHLSLEQVGIFVGSNFVVTAQQMAGDCLDAVRERIRTGRGRVRKENAFYLAYAITDAIVDHYFPVVEALNVRLEICEQSIIATPRQQTVREIHALRQEIGALRRVLDGMRLALEALMRGEFASECPQALPFWRDCVDHTRQLLDALDASRDLSADLLALQAAQESRQMNEVMKVLTMIATIFMPLGFVAGLYGMNFDRASPYNMPELGWTFGYPFALLVMCALVVALVAFFYRKGWIGAGRADVNE